MRSPLFSMRRASPTCFTPPGTGLPSPGVVLFPQRSRALPARLFVRIFIHDELAARMHFRLLDDLIANLFKYPLPTPRRIRYEMLHRLIVGILLAVRNPGKVSVTFHRHLPTHRIFSADMPHRWGSNTHFLPYVHSLGLTTNWINVTLSNYEQYSARAICLSFE